MPKYGRLSKQSDFSNIYKNGKKWHFIGANIYFLPSENMRFAAVASKKIGNAVTRNRAKRRLRAMFALCYDSLKVGEYVMIAKDTLNTLEHKKAMKNLQWALGKLGAFK